MRDADYLEFIQEDKVRVWPLPSASWPWAELLHNKKYQDGPHFRRGTIGMMEMLLNGIRQEAVNSKDEPLGFTYRYDHFKGQIIFEVEDQVTQNTLKKTMIHQENPFSIETGLTGLWNNMKIFDNKSADIFLAGTYKFEEQFKPINDTVQLPRDMEKTEFSAVIDMVCAVQNYRSLDELFNDSLPIEIRMVKDGDTKEYLLISNHTIKDFLAKADNLAKRPSYANVIIRPPGYLTGDLNFKETKNWIREIG